MKERGARARLAPSEWEELPLAELFTFQNGVNADKAAYGSGTPFINVLEVISSPILTAAKIPGKVKLPAWSNGAFQVRRGDLLFNRTSETQKEVGLAAAYDDSAPVVFGGFVIRARPRDESLEPRFAAYALRSSPSVRAQIVAVGQGAIRSNIGQRELSKVVLPVPSKDEQRAISSAISDADSLSEGLQSLIEKKRRIKKGVLQDLLSGTRRLPGFTKPWVRRRFGDMGHTYGGLTGKRKQDFGQGAARYITFMNVMGNVVVDCNALEPVRVESTEKQNQVRQGDLLFNGSSETAEEVGMCAVLTEPVQNVFLNSFCFGFRMHDVADASGLFLAYYFRSGEGRRHLWTLAQGAIRYNLSKTALLALGFHLPEGPEQRAIAALLSDLDDEIISLEGKLTKIRQIGDAMRRELLTGRVRLS